MPHRFTSPLAIAVVALTLTACTADTTPGPPAPDPGTGASPVATAGPDGSAGDVGEATREQSPIEQIFGGAATALAGVSAEDRSQRHLQLETGIAECMAEQGFTYHVVPWDGEDDPAPTWGDAELLETGYGISTLLDDAPEDDGDDGRHPNDVAEEAMSKSELAAYRLALGGEPAAGEDFAEWDEEDVVDVPLEERGCVGKVEHALFGDPVDVWGSEEFGPLLEDLLDIYFQVEQDPRVVTAQQAWSDCVADAGFPGLSARWDASNMLEAEWYEMWDGEEPVRLDPRVAEFRERELTVARADVECVRGSQVDTIRTEVTHEAEQAFIELHRAELEALDAALTAQHTGSSQTD